MSFKWSELLRYLMDYESASLSVHAMTSAGIPAGSFDTSRKAKALVVEALVRREDELEGKRHGRVESDAVRTARRALEREVWP